MKTQSNHFSFGLSLSGLRGKGNDFTPCCKESMLPYFYDAGHHSYARYGSYYLSNMEKQPQEVILKFMKREHVMRHQQGYWSGICSGMYIETSFICYGKGPGGDCWVNLKRGVVKKRANSLHICTEILKDPDEMRNWETSKDLEFHKKESKGWIRSDEEDRTSLKDTLKKCINPLDTDVNGLVNIYTEIKVQKSNVYDQLS